LNEKDLKLTVTYRANDGITCCDEPTRVTLRGNGTGVVQAVHEDRLFLGAIPPTPGRFCDCDSEPQVQFTVLMAHVSAAGMKHLKIETPSTSGGFQYGILKSTDGVIGSLQTLRSQGLAKVIAEPRIVTLNGRSAMFKSGGEVPTLLRTSASAAYVNEFVGTSIELLPTVTSAGKLCLKVCPEVSHLNGTTKRGNTMAINKQAAQLAVNMNDGQTLVMLGSEMITDKGEKQNLVVIVTPHLIQSTAAVKANKQVPLTDIAAMSKRGISDDIIIRQMQLTESMYDLTTEQILSLHEQGVSNAVIRAMQERRADRQPTPSALPSGNPAY
jgi:Flp pilus assembly secretin CpaC